MRKRSSYILDRLLSASEFRAIGADEQGVPHYLSKFKGIPPRYIGWISIFMGASLSVFAMLITLDYLTRLSTPDSLLMVFLGVVGSLGGLGAIGCGLWLRRIRKRLAHLTSQEQACSQLGISQEELKQIAQSKGVKPSCNINSNDYYNLDDLDGASSLLRASGKPTTHTETLLRPAEYNAQTPAEQLLRVPNNIS